MLMLPHRMAWAAMLVLPVAFLTGCFGVRGIANPAPSVTVHYHDLNLDSDQGVAGLYARIHAAAESVCRSSEDAPVAHRTISREGDCVNDAVARAVHAVRNDKLSAYHWTKIRGWKLHRFAARTSMGR